MTIVDPERTIEVRSLVELMQNVLDGAVAAYAASGVSLPDRQYWTLGQPAVDCEQLVVFFTQAYIGPPGDEANTPSRCDGPRTAVLTVQVSRCIPTTGPTRGSAPTAASIQAGSEQLAIDAWLLLDVAASLDTWGLGVIATVDADEPQGGYQSVSLSLTLAIP